MSAAEHAEEPRVVPLGPEEALAHARPFPPKEALTLSDVTDEEWESFFDVIEHR